MNQNWHCRYTGGQLNILAVEVRYEEHRSEGEIDFIAKQRLLIDGIEVRAAAVDLISLGRSVRESGDFPIFTCGCGSPECAYIEQRVAVRHEDGRTYWTMRMPVAYWYPGDPQDHSIEEMFANWLGSSAVVEFAFDRAEIIAELVSAVDWLLTEAPEETYFIPHGTERKDLLELLTIE